MNHSQDSKQLNAKNYRKVYVSIRGFDEDIVMDYAPGKRLMDFLTGDKVSTHVHLTDDKGETMVIATRDIKLLLPGDIEQDLSQYV